jgi:eukaryotic-like serine/threonine-protein kinase
VMSRLKSDHVVDVVDVISAPDGRTCIITELLEGADLEQHLAVQGGKLSVGDAVYFVRQCLRGLSAAHALGVVHRDLKPSNLFLARDTSGRVTLKVLDFGVAKNGGDAELTAVGTIMGTPAYMAPEQARGARFADERSDLYSVGAVLYRLLTGRPPYEEADVNGTLIRLMQEAPQRPSTVERSIPAGLEAVIERAMAREPAQRYQTAADFDAALTAFDGGQPERALDPRASGGRKPSSAEVTTLGRKARLARPAAIATVAFVSLLSGLACSAVLALLVDSLSDAPRLGTTELLLVALVGGGCTIAMLISLLRALAGAFRNVVTVETLQRRLNVTALSFTATLGVLELSGIVVSTFVHAQPTELDPMYACLRMSCALLAGAAALFRTRRTPT